MPVQITKAPVTTLGALTKMKWHARTIHMYAVSEPELNELTAGYNSLNLVLFGIFAGAAITLAITCATTTRDSSQMPYFFLALLVSIAAAAITGVRGWADYYWARKRKQQLTIEEDIVVK